MQKVRRNALHRYWEANKEKLAGYGITIEPDTRKLSTPNVGITLETYLETAEIAKICNGYMRMQDMTEKMTQEILAEKMQDKLL
jgi:hypothetical protein